MTWGRKLKRPDRARTKGLDDNKCTLQVSWSGIADPNEEDFIAIYTPPSAAHHDFLEKHLVTESVTWAQGELIPVTVLINCFRAIKNPRAPRPLPTTMTFWVSIW
jgi:hypothetical protein